MSKILYTLFVAIALTLSMTARAAETLVMPFSNGSAKQTPLRIQSVGVDQANLELEITGRMPNPCYAEPTAYLEPDVADPAVLVLRLTSPAPTDLCVLGQVEVQRVEEYKTVVSLPVLAQTADLQLVNKAVYTVRTEGYAFEMQVIGSDLMRVPGFYAQ